MADRSKPAEVAKITSLSLRNIQAMSSRGQIPGAAKLGGVWSFDREKIEAWIKNGEQRVRARRVSNRRRKTGKGYNVTDGRTSHEEWSPGYIYRRGRFWWGRVKSGGKEYRFSLRTGDQAEAIARMKVRAGKLAREDFGMFDIADHPWVYFIHDITGGFIKVGISQNVTGAFMRLSATQLMKLYCWVRWQGLRYWKICSINFFPRFIMLANGLRQPMHQSASPRRS